MVKIHWNPGHYFQATVLNEFGGKIDASGPRSINRTKEKGKKWWKSSRQGENEGSWPLLSLLKISRLFWEGESKIVSIAILHWGMREIIENQYLSYDPLMPMLNSHSLLVSPFNIFHFFFRIFFKLRNSINLSLFFSVCYFFFSFPSNVLMISYTITKTSSNSPFLPNRFWCHVKRENIFME